MFCPASQAAAPRSDRTEVRVLHGDLEYHILLVRLLSVSTEGKNGVAEATCQNLYTAENVLEHLKVICSSTVAGRVLLASRRVCLKSSVLCLQVTSGCLDLKTAFLELLSNVYLDTDDPLDGTESEVRSCSCVPSSS